MPTKAYGALSLRYACAESCNGQHATTAKTMIFKIVFIGAKLAKKDKSSKRNPIFYSFVNELNKNKRYTLFIAFLQII